MTAFERWLLWTSTVLTTVTGTVYLWTKYFVESADPWAVINHPWQPLALKAHILVAPVFVFVLGAVVLRHGLMHLQMRIPARRTTGLILLGGLLPMLLSGYAVQVVTGETAARVWALTHIGTSLAFVALLTWHGARRAAADADATETPIIPLGHSRERREA
jgi:hypothetical protein